MRLRSRTVYRVASMNELFSMILRYWLVASCWLRWLRVMATSSHLPLLPNQDRRGRAWEDNWGRLYNPARLAQPQQPALRTSHFPDPPTTTLRRPSQPLDKHRGTEEQRPLRSQRRRPRLGRRRTQRPTTQTPRLQETDRTDRTPTVALTARIRRPLIGTVQNRSAVCCWALIQRGRGDRPGCMRGHRRRPSSGASRDCHAAARCWCAIV